MKRNTIFTILLSMAFAALVAALGFGLAGCSDILGKNPDKGPDKGPDSITAPGRVEPAAKIGACGGELSLRLRAWR